MICIWVTTTLTNTALEPKLDKVENYLSTTMGCGSYELTENAFIQFIIQGNKYEFQGEKLILGDTKGQKIQFKPYIAKGDNANAK